MTPRRLTPALLTLLAATPGLTAPAHAVPLKDGEALQVSLDKSMLGCFFVCR